ncbi:hypothetical protein [Acidithiobacillus sp.]|uniref:hypothetical protein n=1 Tax=Acidithiobacillus sp. TaxID=1872118 RepID=UPI0025BB1B28|nr:hypothetical protein [Acidithiobacillus sp.]
MANANAVASSDNTVTPLTPKQWEGLGKVGDAALQIQSLLQMLRDVLAELPNAIDTEKLLAKYQPQLDALRETVESLQGMLTVEGGTERLKALLSEVKEAQLDKTLGELITILNNLQKSGFFASLAALSGELRCPLIGDSPEDMVQKLRAAAANLQYWANSAREGVGVIGNVVSQLDLPDRLDEIQEMADQWLQLAKRAQRLIQGDAPSLHDRLDGILNMGEILAGQMSVAIGTLTDTAPELLKSADMSGALATIGSGGRRWLGIALRVKALAQGDAPDLAARVEGLLDQIEHLAGYGENLRFFLQAGKDGLNVVKDMVSEMQLPDKLDELASEAEKWLKIAQRAKALAQGNSESLADRVDGLLVMAETLSQSMAAAAQSLEAQGIHLKNIFSTEGDLNIAFGTAADFLGEMWRDGTIQRIGGNIAQGATIWLEIAQLGGKALKGDAESIASRVREIVQGLHDAKLLDMLPELFALLGNLQKAGLLHKVNLVMAQVVPLMPSDQAFASGVDKAAKALAQTQQEMKDESNRGGGIFGLIKIFFAKDTQYVLRYVVRFASIFLKSMKSPA